MVSTGPWVRLLLRMIAGVTVAAVVFGARPGPALAQDAPAAAAAAEKPDPLKFATQEVVLVYNQVKPDKTTDFESSWATIKAGLIKSEKPELKELGESIKIFKVDAPPGPTVNYFFTLMPPSKTQSYDPTKILFQSGAFSREEADVIYGKLKDCYAPQGISAIPLVKVGG
jgi:hypothetical protein